MNGMELLDNSLIVAHITSILYVRLSFGFYLNTVFKLFNRKYGKEFEKHMREIRKAEAHEISVIDYFLFSGMVTIEFFLIEWISRNVVSGLLGTIVSTGIHIPFILMLSGLLLIRIDLDVSEKKRILYIVTLTASLAFLLWNWRLGLVSITIVLGKFIWIDFLFDFRLRTIREYLKRLKNNSMESVVVSYCVRYLVFLFLFQLMAYIVKQKGGGDVFYISSLLTPFVLIGVPLVMVRRMVER